MSSTAERVGSIAHQVCERLIRCEGDGQSLVGALHDLSDDSLTALLGDVSALRAEADRVVTAIAGVVAKRSEHARGYAGLAQREGHRNPVALIQAVTGVSRAEAARQVRMGQACDEADAARAVAGDDSEIRDEGVEPPAPWYLPITAAVDKGEITAEAGAAILRGLGQPSENCSGDRLAETARRLLDVAGGVHVDELAKRARWAREDLDPASVSARADERYRARSWRFGKNASGAKTAWVVFDDESAAWMDALLGAALSPRRGGPRFVSDNEAARGAALRADERTNDQLAFDTIMDTLRAGACADADTVFGTRQPGVRLVVTQRDFEHRDEAGDPAGTGYFEDGGEAAPGAVIEQHVCNSGIVAVTADGSGSPLDVGREQRCFTSRQRVALRVRDGGCLWPRCEQVASYAEAHHINEWVADRGRTDTADGVLLCRHHHLLLHNNKWKIRRTGNRYRLIPPRAIDPGQTPIPLQSKSRLRARAG